jgi:hypothetical protein
MKLTAIATDMTEKATLKGSAYTALPRGLELVMQRNEEHYWRLAVARRDTTPSLEEIEIVRDAFNVPAGTEETTEIKKRLHPKTNMPITYHVVEMKWYEAQPAQ